MNELNLIRALLAEAPPSAEVIAEGRRRIAGQPTRRRRAPVRWAFTSAGLVAAAAAATAITLTATAGAPAAGPAASTPPAVPPRLHFGPAITPAGVLRNAALAALQLPAGAPRPDQFVYTKLYEYQQMGGSPHGGVLRTWSSVDGTRFGVEDAGPKLKSALPACRSGHWWGKAVGKPAEDDKVGCTLAVAAAYRPGMPTSPGALGAYLHKILFVDPADSGGLLVQTEQMITTGYLTPAQLAAIYRLLAQTPGLTLVPHATNVKGQTGVGVRSGIWKGSVYTIIFDPKTYAPLGMDWTGVAGPMKGTRNGEVLLKTSIVSNTPPLP